MQSDSMECENNQINNSSEEELKSYTRQEALQKAKEDAGVFLTDQPLAIKYLCSPSGGRCKYGYFQFENEFNIAKEANGVSIIENNIRSHFNKVNHEQEPPGNLTCVIFESFFYHSSLQYLVRGNPPLRSNLVAIQHHPGGHPLIQSDKDSKGLKHHYHVREAKLDENNVYSALKYIPKFVNGTTPEKHYWYVEYEDQLEDDDLNNNQVEAIGGEPCSPTSSMARYFTDMVVTQAREEDRPPNPSRC